MKTKLDVKDVIIKSQDNKPQHTPTPWKVGNGHMIYTSDFMTMIATTRHEEKMAFLECDANAAYIVRAVNSHDELLDALRGARDYFLNGVDKRGTLRNIEQAIAKAEGK